MKRLLSHPLILCIESIFVVFLPVVTLAFHPELLVYQLEAIGIGIGYVCLIAFLSHADFRDFGFTKSRFIASLKSLIVLSVGVSTLLIVFGIMHIRIGVFPQMLHGFSAYGNIIGLLLYVFVSVPLQEMIFRGYVIWRLERVFKNQVITLWGSAIIFALMHLPFGNLYVVGVAFIFGIWSARIYLRDRNIYAIMISHALIGGAEIIRQVLLQ